MRLRAPLGVIASLLCAPLACQAPPKQPPVGALIVRAPTAGVVSVRGRARALWPPSPARLEGLGPGPYDVTLNLDDSRVTILGVEGPEVDFSGLLGAPSPLKGPLMRLAVRVEGGAAVGIVGDRLIRPIDGALWVPEGAPLALIALWSGAEPPQAALRYIEAPSTFEGRQVYLTPAYALDDEVRLTLTGLDGAAVSAEIAFAGVRTGLIIGEGVVEGGRLRLPQLPAGIHEGLGLWLEARAPTWRGAAQAGAWIAAGARAATLEAPPPLRFAALPGEPLSAPPLPRASASLLGGPPATIYEIELEGWGACGAGRPWRIFTRALDGLSLPKPEDQDPLAAPLIHARVRWTGLEALGFEALGFEALGFEALLKGPLPWSPRAASRAVEGWYAGGGCAGGDVEAGLYALYDEARCAGPAPRVVLDRCGRLIPLDGACLLDEPTLHRAPQRLDLGGGRWLARLPRAGVAAPPSLEGAWGWVEIYEEGEAGAPPTITRSPPGEAWLFISAAGLVTLESPALRLEGRLAWSATSALEVERLGVDCGAYRALTLTQAPGYLHLSERIEGAGGPRLRRVSAWRG